MRHAKQVLEVTKEDLLLPLLVHFNHRLMLDARDEVLGAPTVCCQLKKFGVGISFPQPPDSRSLPLDGPFQRG